jgi:hypothetical protein
MAEASVMYQRNIMKKLLSFAMHIHKNWVLELISD